MWNQNRRNQQQRIQFLITSKKHYHHHRSSLSLSLRYVVNPSSFTFFLFSMTHILHNSYNSLSQFPKPYIFILKLTIVHHQEPHQQWPMSSSEEASSMETTTIDKDLHVTFAQMMYHLLPNPYESQEINHLTLAYFVISSLDILNSLHLVYISTLLFSFIHYLWITNTDTQKTQTMTRTHH